jgi:CRISPR-associated protein Csd1
MTEANTGICLVTGQESIIARTHAKIKNINNPEPNLVSFNEAAYCSYGKEQGENAPIGENAADAYTKALNHLLGKDSMQKIRLENTITVFWAQKKNVRAEAMLSSIFARKGNPKDNPDENSVVIKNLLKSPHKGGAPLPVDDRFYLLGLSPNAARLSVRFWLPTTATAIEEKLRAYFKQIHLEGGKLPYPPLRSLLSSLALEYKLENLSPILEGQVLQSIFSGADFPRTLLAVALARMRAEQNLPHLRAALIKAYLIRNGKKEITVSLDENCKDTPYLLGRLFSTLEKTQKDADTGDTIKNYFGAASMRPATVFPTLLKLHKHHLAKLGKEKIGLAVTREKLVIGIFGLLAATSFPATFSMEEQGMFAIGYYHQRQTFYTKSEKPESPESQAA